MRVSSHGRFALRAMADLAQHGDHGLVSRQELSERQEIKADYLAQLFMHPQAAELVERMKGSRGGYRLTRDPSLIRPGHLILAEGPVADVNCTLPNADD